MRWLALNMASDADDKVYLDFADVPFISLSFADEFINKLMREVGLVTFIKNTLLWICANLAPKQLITSLETEVRRVTAD